LAHLINMNKFNINHKLPSSIHELILVPTIDHKSSKEYSDMVQEINATQVAFEEVLSDRVYYYSREKGLSVIEC
jgi:hypothetical protein